MMQDGEISRAEFDEKANQIFERLDANGDGVIARDEIPQPGKRFGMMGRMATPPAPADAPADAPAEPTDN